MLLRTDIEGVLQTLDRSQKSIHPTGSDLQACCLSHYPKLAYDPLEQGTGCTVSFLSLNSSADAVPNDLSAVYMPIPCGDIRAAFEPNLLG